jgi:hypothetical protein
MNRIFIEEAECLVPKRGTQEQRRQIKERLFQENPAYAAQLEAIPGYQDPDDKFAGDEYATFNWSWFGENEIMRGFRTHVLLTDLPLLKDTAISVPVQHEPDSWIEYSFHVKASYALAVLISKHIVLGDSVLANDSDMPHSLQNELEMATA